MNLLTDIPPQELLSPVEDARTVLKGWSETEINEKLIELFRFILNDNTVIANGIYSEASDYIDIFFSAWKELNLPIRKSGIKGANNYLTRATNTEPKIDNISVEEMLAMLILKDVFSGNSKAAFKGAYQLSRLKLKRPKRLEKYLESAGMRKKVGGKRGGIKSGKTRKDKIALRNVIIADYIIDVAKSTEARNIVGKVARKLRDLPITDRQIRNIIHSHPSLKHISPLISRK